MAARYPEQRLQMPYPVSINHYYNRAVGGKVYLSQAGHVYKQEVALKAALQGVWVMGGALAITVRLYRPAKRGDIDNGLKCLIDSLNGIAWDDDAQIVEMHLYRLDDKENPRAELKVKQVQS